MTAPPRALLAVKPKRAMSGDAAFVSPRARAWSTSEGAAKRDPSLTCRNSARVLRRPIAVTLEAGGALAADQADRRLRPLALRRASTLRPPVVDMRARKPWRRLRTSRDG